MKVRSLALGMLIVGVAAPGHAGASTPSLPVERIIVIRHGEKPAAGLGQLACKGLSRSLALPDVILARFGKPDDLFAPNPGHRKPDQGVSYNYIRPLATIEPLAIRAGLPVNVNFGFDEAVTLARALEAPRFAGKTVVVAWEHVLAVALEKELIGHYGGDPRQVTHWKGDDFDRMDVIEIDRGATGQAKRTQVSYSRDKQGLNDVSEACPTGARPSG